MPEFTGMQSNVWQNSQNESQNTDLRFRYVFSLRF